MKKSTRIIITILAVVGILALIAYVLTNNKKKNEAKTAVVAETNSAIAVKIDTVKTADLNIDFNANGIFAAGQEINFAAETAGRVISVLVDEGSYVRKGQTLAVIKTDNLDVDVQNANEVYQNALKDKERYESAFKTGGVTQQQVDQAEGRRRTPRRDVQAMQRVDEDGGIERDVQRDEAEQQEGGRKGLGHGATGEGNCDRVSEQR